MFQYLLEVLMIEFIREEMAIENRGDLSLPMSFKTVVVEYTRDENGAIRFICAYTEEDDPPPTGGAFMRAPTEESAAPTHIQTPPMAGLYDIKGVLGASLDTSSDHEGFVYLYDASYL